MRCKESNLKIGARGAVYKRTTHRAHKANLLFCASPTASRTNGRLVRLAVATAQEAQALLYLYVLCIVCTSSSHQALVSGVGHVHLAVALCTKPDLFQPTSRHNLLLLTRGHPEGAGPHIQAVYVDIDGDTGGATRRPRHCDGQLNYDGPARRPRVRCPHADGPQQLGDRFLHELLVRPRAQAPQIVTVRSARPEARVVGGATAGGAAVCALHAGNAGLQVRRRQGPAHLQLA
mmetsp:Transcript_84291/g.257382  ORF Transcript_84291/g.257382 Transcript_84291/m.257382 type:complete len:233 (-) Transcript_84291:1077-1775(-)